jgi:hypothetical protein
MNEFDCAAYNKYEKVMFEVMNGVLRMHPAIMECKDLSWRERAHLARIQNVIEELGQCVCTYADLASGFGTDKRNTIRICQSLERSGYVAICKVKVAVWRGSSSRIQLKLTGKTATLLG